MRDNSGSPWLRLLPFVVGLAFASGCGSSAPSSNPSTSDRSNAGVPARVQLLNVSYDPTRELYQEFNASFAEYWKGKTGQVVTIDQSHGGSGKQARAVIDGLEADVVTLALAYDIDAIAKKAQALPSDWQKRLPNNSCPYSSTIVFLVRKGNPKHIKDWDDLTQKDLAIITPNPKTSGGARWNYLAAWGFALRRELGEGKNVTNVSEDELRAANEKARQFVAEIYKKVPVLDSGARGSTNTFLKSGLGDVLLAWENEAFLAIKETGDGQVEMIVPSVSILAEPPVATVDQVVDKRGTKNVAQAYLEHLYSPQGQQLAAKHFFRPFKVESISQSEREKFANVKLFTIAELFKSWPEAQANHFDDGGVFDQIYQPGK